jgi:hypothetical protein
MNSQQASGGIGSAPDSAGSNQSLGQQGVRAKAGEAVSKVADVAQEASSQVKQAAASLASEANQQAKGFLNQQLASGADLVGNIADSLRAAADNLNQNTPQLPANADGQEQSAKQRLVGIRVLQWGAVTRTLERIRWHMNGCGTPA